MRVDHERDLDRSDDPLGLFDPPPLSARLRRLAVPVGLVVVARIVWSRWLRCGRCGGG